MRYEFECDKCQLNKVVERRMKDAGLPEDCDSCGDTMRRIYSANIHFIGASVQHAEYNPAFGKIVKNKQERDELAKRHNMIEIGNEKIDHDKMEKRRQEEREKSWDKLTEEAIREVKS